MTNPPMTLEFESLSESKQEVSDKPMQRAITAEKIVFLFISSSVFFECANLDKRFELHLISSIVFHCFY